MEATAKLTGEERAAVGKYLEVATEIFARRARVQGAGAYRRTGPIETAGR